MVIYTLVSSVLRSIYALLGISSFTGLIFGGKLGGARTRRRKEKLLAQKRKAELKKSKSSGGGGSVPPSSLPGHEQHIDDDGGYDSDFFRDVTRNGAATTVYENLRNIASIRQFLRLLLNTSLIPFNEVRLVTQSRFYRVFQPLVFEGNKPCYAHERQQFKYYERIQERELFLKQAELNRIYHESTLRHHNSGHIEQQQQQQGDDEVSIDGKKKVTVKHSTTKKRGSLHKKLGKHVQHASPDHNDDVVGNEDEDDYVDEEDDHTTDSQPSRDLQTQEDPHPMEPIVDINDDDHHNHQQYRHNNNNIVVDGGSNNAASSIVANAAIALQASSSPQPAPKRFYVSKFAAEGGRNNVDIEADAKMGITEEVRQHGWRSEKKNKKKHASY
eukprot:TRINITY_DN19199_c0_g1_i2.p1 TRINITY_DN19199_c0_g1~~TRINITY_DN19199_c0_g1_i2.p1  ORF type:complete len:386 (-),score=63.81 TRINITY_DN19199_c0_g1_i2:58-1215(-)